MIKVENVDVYGFEAAIRGMRAPMNSWAKSDSHRCEKGVGCDYCANDKWCRMMPQGFKVGSNDLGLMQRLYKGGAEHRKYLRMIHIQMDITAPLYWWKEWDTYKVGTTANSCSTMHKIHAKEFTIDDFSHEHISDTNVLWCIPAELNVWRKLYLETKDKKYWWQMIQLLPSSYNQRRTVDFSYETAVNMIKQRSGHKLDEWNEFVKILLGLPYIKEIMEVWFDDRG